MIWTICRRDLIFFFSTPLAWLVLFAWCLIINFIFYVFDLLPAFGSPTYQPLFYDSVNLGTKILVLLAPALTMNSFALERSQGTMQLLQTVPVREWQLLLGKFLSCWVMLLTLVLATLPQIIVLYFVSSLHCPSLCAAYLGYFLLSGLFAAIGVWISLIVDSPIAAYVLTFGAIIFLFLIGFLSEYDGIVGSIGHFLGLGSRLEGFISGNLSLGQIVFFICLIGVFLSFSITALRARRIYG